MNKSEDLHQFDGRPFVKRARFPKEKDSAMVASAYYKSKNLVVGARIARPLFVQNLFFAYLLFSLYALLHLKNIFKQTQAPPIVRSPCLFSFFRTAVISSCPRIRNRNTAHRRPAYIGGQNSSALPRRSWNNPNGTLPESDRTAPAFSSACRCRIG